MIDFDTSDDHVVHGDSAEVLPKLPDGKFQLIYVDPPFNTGKVQQRRTLQTVRSTDGDRVGFGGQSYRTTEVSRMGYPDVFNDYIAFLGPKLEEAHRLLSEDGTGRGAHSRGSRVAPHDRSVRSARSSLRVGARRRASM